MNNVNNWINSP